MQFCPKCKSIIMPKKEGDKVVLRCSCGYEATPDKNDSLKDKKEKKDETDIAVIEKEVEVLPICKDECPKCGNGEAYYWLVQTRSADEAMTKFMKCTKCKHTWRDYD